MSRIDIGLLDELMELRIEKCESNKLSIVLDLLYKAATWLKTANIDYWQNWLNPPDFHVAWIKEGLDKGEFYFVYNSENILVGMYRLQYSDKMFWGERHDKAGYIHSFTTNRNYKGNNIGHYILGEIENYLFQKGFEYLRLDCSPEIRGLCKYYEDYGFTPKGTVVVHGETLKLYEKKINSSSTR